MEARHDRSFNARAASGGLRRRLILATAVAVLALVPASSTVASDAKDVLGWVEWVIVGEHGIELKAKLDTGAETSSLDATGIRRLRRRSTGQRLVEFDVTDPGSGATITLKKDLVREARIKQHDGSFQTRPVVEIVVCLGGHLQEVEVSLIDRSEFLYPLLLGRSALAGVALVDPDMTLTRKPSCDDPEDGP